MTIHPRTPFLPARLAIAAIGGALTLAANSDIFRAASAPDTCPASLASAAGGRGLTDEGQLRAFCRWHAALSVDTRIRMAGDAAFHATPTETYMVDWYIQNLAPH